MKKRALSLIMSLALCLTLLPAASLAEYEPEEDYEADYEQQWQEEQETEEPVAEPEELDVYDGGDGIAVYAGHANHNICADDSCKDHDGIGVWSEWDFDYLLPNSGGCYYLTKDVKLSATWKPSDGTILCLNGHTIEMTDMDREPAIEVGNGVNFTLTDCGSTGKVKHATDAEGNVIKGIGVIVDYGGSFDMYGGSITGNVSNFNKNTASGVVLGNGSWSNGPAVFTMYGGSITGNSDAGDGRADICGGVYVGYNSTFTMKGGSIDNNSSQFNAGAVQVASGGVFNMTGGRITGNAARYGGVYNNGTFSMTGGEISGNVGVGVFVYGKTTIGGDAKVIDNREGKRNSDDVYVADENGKVANIWLTDICTLEIEDGFKGEVGVAREGGKVGTTIAKNAKSGDEKYFTSDDAAYTIEYNEKEETLVLAERTADTHTHYLCTTEDECTGLGGHTESGKVTFEAWTETTSLPDKVGNYYLTENVTLSKNWIVPDGVVLCLNGKTVKMNSTSEVIAVGDNDGTAVDFTLTDCEGSGGITHDKNITGRGVFVGAHSTFDMYGGNITGNELTNNAGGAGVATLGTFNMYGGSIDHNAADGSNLYGGGVFVSGGEFNMAGGSVTDNTSTAGGGGVFVNVNGAGTSVAKFTVSGDITIKDNTTNGNDDNVYLEASNDGNVLPHITVADELTGDPIGVSTKKTISGDDYIVVALGVNGAAVPKGTEDHFTSDSDAYEIVLENAMLRLRVKSASEEEHVHYLCTAEDNCTGLGGHSEDEEITFTAWTENDSLPAEAGNYYLAGNVTLNTANRDSQNGIYYGWDAPDGVVLCLNGYTITMENPEITNSDGSLKDIDIIKVSGHFTLTDCHTGDEQGKITHGTNVSGEKYKGKGIHILGGTFDMFGGIITGNTTRYDTGGSGVCVRGVSDTEKSSIFNMYGGSITGNSGKSGGGVDVTRIVWYGPAVFYMYGGSITNNVADSDWESYGVGGGVYVSWTAKFVMSGGTISGNSATQFGGGVYASALAKDSAYDTGDAAKLEFSGTATVTGNTADGKPGNVYLGSSASNYEEISSKITLSGTPRGEIGIDTETAPTLGHPIIVATDAYASVNYPNAIKPDNSDYEIQNRPGGVLVLAVKGDDTHVHVWNNYTVDENDKSKINLTCADCTESGGWAKIKVPASLKYTGSRLPATFEVSSDWKGGEITADDIGYSDISELSPGYQSAPLDLGSYRAYLVLRAGNSFVKAMIEYSITKGESGEKTDVSSKITFPDGELTYTGSALKYENASIEDGYTGSFTYTYAVKDGGKLDASGLPVDAGTYTVTANYEDDDNVGAATATLTVKKASSEPEPEPTPTPTPEPSKPSSGGSHSTTYPVSTPSKTENGSVSGSLKSAPRGATVTITVTPDEGYELRSLTVTDKDGNELELTDKGNGRYSFTMPAGGVDVDAEFVRETEQSPFRDVSTGAYYYEAVKWASENDVTGGTGSGLFSPDAACTRAQIVTFLWRAAGSPEPSGTADFEDVSGSDYYAKAVAWAVESGITTGTAETAFSPDAACTRAQAVTFLCRAAKAAASGNAGFTDVPENAYYAAAVKWASDEGITTGIGSGLFGPDAACTRAQIVTFLWRLYAK